MLLNTAIFIVNVMLKYNVEITPLNIRSGIFCL